MENISAKELKGYFNPAELELIVTGQELPVGKRIADRLCLKRVGTTVINGLIAASTKPIAVKPFPSDLDLVPHPSFTDPNETLKVQTGTLPVIDINGGWQFRVSLHVPADSREVDGQIRGLNPEPLQNGIRDPRGVVAATVALEPTAKVVEGADSVYLTITDQAAYWYNRLVFTRVSPSSDFEWETREHTIPIQEQTELMLLLGKTAAIELPYSV